MVWLYVSLLIFSAEVNCSMLFGTEKYSGSAMNAGFCWAALRIAVAAASRLPFRLLRTFMWTRLTFKPFTFTRMGLLPLADYSSSIRTEPENF